MTLDIKNTLTAAIADLESELKAVASRLEHVESAAMTHGTAIHQVQQTVNAHSQHLLDMHRHMEDLDNRGRRCNLRIKGILQSIEGPQLQAAVWAICNTLWGRPPDAPVEMERCHRMLRPRGRDTDPPRDAVRSALPRRRFYVWPATRHT